MKTSFPTIIAVLTIGAVLVDPSLASAREKRRPETSPQATASAEREQRMARARMNEGCMTNDEVRAVAAVLAERRQRQDEEAKQYELFKFHREVLIAKASAPQIVVETGTQVGEAEAPTSSIHTASSRHSSKTTERLGAYARTVWDGSTGSNSEVAPADKANAVDAGPVPADDAVRQLMGYPAKYFSKLAAERDAARRQDAEAKKDMLEFIMGEKTAPIIDRGAELNADLPALPTNGATLHR